MTNAQLVSMIVTLIGFAVLVAGGAVYIRSAVVKANHQELETLAETRGHRIEDLEASVARLSDEVVLLKGQMAALQSLKAQEIAFEVARLLGRNTGDIA